MQIFLAYAFKSDTVNERIDWERKTFGHLCKYRASTGGGGRRALDGGRRARAGLRPRARGWPVAVQSTGHGARVPVEGGLLLTMRRLDDVRLDVSHRRATVGAGARWGALVATAAPTVWPPSPARR